jgi:hypothetical protein
VNGHLITVEVGVERLAHEGMQLDGFALDEHGFECLDTEAVQRRCTVEEHRVLLHDLPQHVPHLAPSALDHALGRLDVLGIAEVDEALHHERLEQFEGHDLRKAALVETQLRTDDDDRAA